MKTKLVITIDVEEKGEIWAGDYSDRDPDVSYLGNIDKLQSLFDKYGVRPTYLLSFPVLKNKKIVELFKKIEKDNRCKLGTHIHAWNTPPFEEQICERNTYLCNLDPVLSEKKLKNLAEKFEKEIYHKPSSHKFGRFGMDPEGLRILKKLGYNVDTSVTPFTNHPKGPDFSDFPVRPYFPSIGKKQKQLLEIPATIRFTRKDEKRWQMLFQFIKKKLPSFHIVGIIDILGICRRINLNPENSDFKRMKKISNILIKRKEPVLHMMFHSSNIVVGGTPYVKDKKMHNEFFERLENILDYLVNAKKVDSMSCTEFYEYTL